MTYKSLFIFDIHLGTRGCLATMSLDFRAFHDAPRIFPVGDFGDDRRPRRG